MVPSRKKWDEIGPDLPDEVGGAESGRSALDIYVAERIGAPEHRRTKIGLEMLARSVVLIAASWRHTSRSQALMELDQVLKRLHEVEIEVEKIRDDFVRGYFMDRLDTIAALRRSIVEEIRWDERSKCAEAET